MFQFPDLSKIGDEAQKLSARVAVIENNINSLLAVMMQIGGMVQAIHSRVHETAPASDKPTSVVTELGTQSVSAIVAAEQAVETVAQIAVAVAPALGVGLAPQAPSAINVAPGEVAPPTHG